MEKSDFLNNLGNLEQYLFNYSVEIDYSNFVIAIALSTLLGFIIKLTYVKCSNSLNDKENVAYKIKTTAPKLFVVKPPNNLKNKDQTTRQPSGLQYLR